MSNHFNWLLLLPELVLTAGGVVILLLEAIASSLRRSFTAHALLLWCAVGLLLMLRATELLTVFLALETLSLCLYCLAAFHRRISISREAAIKYFLMGAFVSAFALYGIALIYGGTGSTHFE